jgi:hypothetical protein
MDAKGERVRHQNIGGIQGFLLGEKAATIKELREDYDVEDMLNLYEALMVKSQNEFLAYKEAQKK